ncbi:Isochorismatase [Leisingera sp. ANG-M1]|uniref:cysteine hydrolase family protein n=1 Tax=Leisingera sp. ANG-M1 TaxID=1577895 RepID=UPI00057EE8C8|nr:cysteine hydrolase family protein [Leisingera sp. ANG-M1]KIC12000.1 Isochorismatase [Leisingera sp. ANG-M1]
MTKSALILIDIQNDYFPGGKWELHGIEASAANARRLLDQARAQGQFIVHMHHEFASDDAPFFAPGSEGAQIHASMQPADGEPTVLKHHVNSFRDTNLKRLLDENGITDVTIAGDMSHMCIDAAARAAADYGYAVTVVEDACSSRDLEFNGATIAAEDVHKAYMSALGFAYAAIVTTDAYLAA